MRPTMNTTEATPLSRTKKRVRFLEDVEVIEIGGASQNKDKENDSEAHLEGNNRTALEEQRDRISTDNSQPVSNMSRAQRGHFLVFPSCPVSTFPLQGQNEDLLTSLAPTSARLFDRWACGASHQQLDPRSFSVLPPTLPVRRVDDTKAQCTRDIIQSALDCVTADCPVLLVMD